MTDRSRRQVLQYLGISSTIIFGGCSQILQDQQNTETAASTQAPTPTSTSTVSDTATGTATDSDTATENSADEETSTGDSNPVAEYVIDFQPGENAQRTNSVIFNSKYTDETSPTDKVNLGELEELHTNDFQAVAQEEKNIETGKIGEIA
jgi:hypothetical protein